MEYKLIFHPDSHLDIHKALSRYEKINKELGIAFESELIKCYERIAANPLHYFVLHKRLKMRRVILKRFPYKIIFQVRKNNTIYILALMHQQMKTNWRKRLLP